MYEKKPKEFHLQPFFVGLHVKELHILGHDNFILTFHTLWIKPNVHHYKLESVHPKVWLYHNSYSLNLKWHSYFFSLSFGVFFR